MMKRSGSRERGVKASGAATSPSVPCAASACAVNEDPDRWQSRARYPMMWVRKCLAGFGSERSGLVSSNSAKVRAWLVQRLRFACGGVDGRAEGRIEYDT